MFALADVVAGLAYDIIDFFDIGFSHLLGMPSTKRAPARVVSARGAQNSWRCAGVGKEARRFDPGSARRPVTKAAVVRVRLRDWSAAPRCSRAHPGGKGAWRGSRGHLQSGASEKDPPPTGERPPVSKRGNVWTSFVTISS